MERKGIWLVQSASPGQTRSATTTRKSATSTGQPGVGSLKKLCRSLFVKPITHYSDSTYVKFTSLWFVVSDGHAQSTKLISCVMFSMLSHKVCSHVVLNVILRVVRNSKTCIIHCVSAPSPPPPSQGVPTDTGARDGLVPSQFHVDEGR